jgi:hypothetical protein
MQADAAGGATPEARDAPEPPQAAACCPRAAAAPACDAGGNDAGDTGAAERPGARLSGSRETRQRALDAYAILDTPPDGVYDDLAQLAADACGVELAGITFLDWRGERQFWKSMHGFPAGASRDNPLPDAEAERMNICCQARAAARRPGCGRHAACWGWAGLRRRAHQPTLFAQRRGMGAARGPGGRGAAARAPLALARARAAGGSPAPARRGAVPADTPSLAPPPVSAPR